MVVRVFVSGCFDLLHAGHVEFFREAKEYGEAWSGRKPGEKVELIASFASDEVLEKYKRRVSALPQEHKKFLLESIRFVDRVYSSTNPESSSLDFKDAFLKEKPTFLVVTSDDKFEKEKRELCVQAGAQYVKLPKTPPKFLPISTTEIRERIIGQVKTK